MVATPTAAKLVGPDAALSLSNQDMTIRLTGRISGVPGITGSPVVVMPLQALGRSPPEPDLMLVAGPHLDGARLSAIVTRALPGGSVTLHAAALAALTGAPVQRAAEVTLVQAAATAAGFGALVLLLSLVLSARTRDLTLARLATMGLRAGTPSCCWPPRRCPRSWPPPSAVSPAPGRLRRWSGTR